MMKTVAMERDFNFRAARHVVVAFKAGETYQRVTEAAAREIVKANAGTVVEK